MRTTPEEAKTIAIQFLEATGRQFQLFFDPDRINLEQNAPVRNRQYEGRLNDFYSVPLELFLGYEYELVFVEVSASTGKVYGILGPANFIEPAI